MIKDDKVYLRHMLEAIDFITKYCRKLTVGDFAKDEVMQNAIVRQLEIIGEAANQVSVSTKKQLNKVEWLKITGMRNKLIHEYFGVDLNIVWTTIQNELPDLKRAIAEYLKK